MTGSRSRLGAIVVLVVLAMVAASCGSDSGDSQGAAVQDVADSDGSSSCSSSDTATVGDPSAGITDLLGSTLGELLDGAAGAAGGDLFGWALSATGIGSTTSEGLAQLSSELATIEGTLVAICNELAALDATLAGFQCASDANWESSYAGNIDTQYEVYEDYITGTQDGTAIPSNDDLKTWSQQVLNNESGGVLWAVTQLMDDALPDTSTGAIADCIVAETKEAGAPAEGTIDDRPYYEAVVAPIQNWYYAYIVKSFLLLSEAYHIQAWEEAGEPNSDDPQMMLNEICPVTSNSTTTTATASATNSYPAQLTAFGQGSTSSTTEAPTTTEATTTSTTEATTSSTTERSTTSTTAGGTTTTTVSPSLDCGEALEVYNNQVLPWITGAMAVGGAPYSTDEYLMVNGYQDESSIDRLIVSSMEDYSATADPAAGCSSPLETSDLCGPLVGLPTTSIKSVEYGSFYGDGNGNGTWVASNAATFNSMLKGFHDTDDESATSGSWLCHGIGGTSTTGCTDVPTAYGESFVGVGLENADKLIVFPDKVGVEYQKASSGGSQHGPVDAYCFFDGVVTKHLAEQPFCEQESGSTNMQDLMEGHSDGYVCPNAATTDWYDATEWTRDDGNVSDTQYYWGKACPTGSGNALEWVDDEAPGYSADDPARGYLWPTLKWIDLTCTDALSSSLSGEKASNALNPAGVPTMCGDDYLDWFNEILGLVE